MPQKIAYHPIPHPFKKQNKTIALPLGDNVHKQVMLEIAVKLRNNEPFIIIITKDILQPCQRHPQ